MNKTAEIIIAGTIGIALSVFVFILMTMVFLIKWDSFVVGLMCCATYYLTLLIYDKLYNNVSRK